jgi:hypothetical protein
MIIAAAAHTADTNPAGPGRRESLRTGQRRKPSHHHGAREGAGRPTQAPAHRTGGKRRPHHPPPPGRRPGRRSTTGNHQRARNQTEHDTHPARPERARRGTPADRATPPRPQGPPPSAPPPDGGGGSGPFTFFEGPRTPDPRAESFVPPVSLAAHRLFCNPRRWPAGGVTAVFGWRAARAIRRALKPRGGVLLAAHGHTDPVCERSEQAKKRELVTSGVSAWICAGFAHCPLERPLSGGLPDCSLLE